MTARIIYGDYCRKNDQRCDDNCPNRKGECEYRVKWEDLEKENYNAEGNKEAR